MIHKGRGRFQSGSQDGIPLEAGDLLILFPGIPHRYGPPEGECWDESYLVFSGRLFDALWAGDVISPDRPVIHGLGEHGQERMLGLIRLAADSAGGEAPHRASVGHESPAESGAARVRTPAPVYLCMLASFVCEAVSAHPIHRLNSADKAWIEESYAALDAPRPMSLSLSDIAQRMGTSYGSFVKRFTRLTGSAPGQARNRMVMQHACGLLREGELSVSQIADHLGFTDASYFCRRFRLVVGYTPTEFRHMTGGDG
jgi:AraC-like DNA-binding protein